MAYYLVHARPGAELLPTLEDGLRAGSYREPEPFGRPLSASLRDARLTPDGRAWWEEEDYCRRRRRSVPWFWTVLRGPRRRAG